MRNRIKAYVGPSANRDALRDGHWFKARAGISDSIDFCTSNKIPLVTRASGEGIDISGGFVVPPSFDAAILRVVEAQSAFQQGAELRTSTSDEQIRPRRTGGVTASWVGEGQSIPESGFTLDAVDAVATKLGLLVRLSNELHDDSASDLAEFLATEFGYAISGAIDDAAFNGTGASAYGGTTGLFAKLVGKKSNIAAASTHKTFLSIDSTDIGNLMAGVLASALPRSAWYCTNSAYGQTFCRLSVSTGGLVATNNADGTISASYLGYPILFSSKLVDGDPGTDLNGKPMLAFGDLSMAAMLTTRRPLSIAMSLQHTLDSDQVLVRGVTRQSIVVHSVGDASTRGPMAALIGTT
jgi:HK97 family phage major capsid protein